MSETKYIGLDYSDSIEQKKDILASEIEIIQISGAMNSYKNLRKKELDTKSKLKSSLTALRTKINLIQSTFPEKERKKKILDTGFKKEIKQESKKSISFEEELDEIKAKLARLG